MLPDLGFACHKTGCAPTKQIAFYIAIIASYGNIIHRSKQG